MNSMKYFFFDMDGTLTVGTTLYLPESTRETLKKLAEKGHYIAVATGRLQADAIQFCKKMGIKNLVSDGGNGVTINGDLVKLKPLDRDPCIGLLEELEAKGISWGITIENVCVRYSRTDRFLEEVKDTYMETVVIPDLDFHEVEKFYKIYISCSQDMEKDISALQYLPTVRYSERCLFIEPDDKSVGIIDIMNYFEADHKDVVVFGDGTNDLKMFRKEWTSIAMGNAREELKAKADFVTKSCDNNGIEHACRHFGWI